MTSKKFKREYARLNTRQREAVDTIEGPVMVIAGPGTGKTTILTLRIANILKITDTPPSGILALTFTEAGARAMKMKLREIMGSRADEIRIHTFHGFALSIIREFADHFPHLSRTEQITEVEAESLIRDILREKKFSKLRPLGEPDFYVQKILGAISESKREAWTPEILLSFAKDEIKRIKADENSISQRGKTKGKLKAEEESRIRKCERTILLTDIYREYEERKKKERKMDFDDLIFELQQKLKEDNLLLRIIQEKFLYILLDEHQDTNDAQNMIVKLIADFFESPNLFVVGDEKQAIYRFQGASVENFLKFQKTWGTMRVINLADNYRSHQGLLDATFTMIEKNYEEGEHQNLRVKLKSNKKAQKLDVAFCSDAYSEEQFLIKRIKEISKNPSKTVAVIVRGNKEIDRILRILENQGIEVSAERGADIFKHPLGTLFFNLIEFLSDPSKIESLAETVAGGLWDLSFGKQVRIIKEIKSGKTESIEKEIPHIKKLLREISDSGVFDYLIKTADTSGLTKMAQKDPLSAEVWRSIFNLAKELADLNGIQNTPAMLKSLLEYKKTAERKYIKVGLGNIDAKITIMTAHSSKGLEFDYVFLPFAAEEIWIKKNFGTFFVLPREREEGDKVKDERCLFYVAMTRAKEHALISVSGEDDSGRLLTPLRFIEELDQSKISKMEIKTPVSVKAKSEPRSKNVGKEKVEYAKRVLLENGLSVTALNHFIKCPSEFFYKSILKLPEPPTASSEKGNAMHEAMANVWRDHPSPTPPQRRGAKNTENTIIKTVKNYFKHSYLPVFEKEAILEELTINAPIVASELTEHFKIQGKVLVEDWIESYFSKDKVEIRLHGKLDAVVDQEKQVLIFDYKTAQAKSVAAIKGETESSDDNYFRQLVFYKLLLQDNPKYKQKRIEPALVFIRPNSRGKCPNVSIPIEEKDIKKLKSEIALLIETIWSGDFLTTTCSDPTCKYCGYQKLNLTKR